MALQRFSLYCFITGFISSGNLLFQRRATRDNALYHHKLGPRNFTPIWTWIYPPGRPSFLKTSCFEMTLQSLYYKSLTVRKSEWIPTSWQCKILARWNIRTKVLCISFGFFCIMWDLLLAFHAYIRQPEIYGEESIIFLNRKLKKI